jgi:hypothetical protein
MPAMKKKSDAQRTLFAEPAADVDRIRRVRGICFRAGVLHDDEGMRQAFRTLNQLYNLARQNPRKISASKPAKSEPKAK